MYAQEWSWQEAATLIQFTTNRSQSTHRESEDSESCEVLLLIQESRPAKACIFSLQSSVHRAADKQHDDAHNLHFEQVFTRVTDSFSWIHDPPLKSIGPGF